MPIITLLSDFGSRDGYVAAMKGVILTISPDASLVDISHEVAPQDVAEGAWVLDTAWPYFPPGTVHLAVVDPGVGGSRRAVAVEAGGHLFVAPDNGLLTYALRRAGAYRAVTLENPAYRRESVSATFHGRDLFAPAAAHLARGVPLSSLGPPCRDLVTLPWPPPGEAEGGVLVGHVVHVDRFGNLISDIPAERMGEAAVVEVGRLRGLRVARTYSAVAEGEALALVGSHGHLEVAVRQGSAALESGADRGAEVRVQPAH